MIDQRMSKSSRRTTTFLHQLRFLCRAPEIQDLIQREIAVNVNFARVETIKKFFLIERQLTPG